MKNDVAAENLSKQNNWKTLPAKAEPKIQPRQEHQQQQQQQERVVAAGDALIKTLSDRETTDPALDRARQHKPLPSQAAPLIIFINAAQ